MSNAMRPSHWTSSYNDQYRDPVTKRIAPHAAEPMEHFPGFYDPSHHTLDRGFRSTRSMLASQARSAATDRGQSLRGPVEGQGDVGYGAAPAKGAPSQSFYAPGPDPAGQNYSSLRQTAAGPLSLRSPASAPAAQEQFSPSQAQAQGFSPASPSGAVYKDLWNAPILPHGDRRAYSEARPLAPPPQFGSPTHAQTQPRYGAAPPSPHSPQSAQQQHGLTDPSFVDGSGEWRYDARGTAMTRGVDLSPLQERPFRYHIPGFAGHVKHKQFMFGSTYAKTTRECLDIPLHLPTETE